MNTSVLDEPDFESYQAIEELAKKSATIQFLQADTIPHRAGVSVCKSWALNQIKRHHAKALETLTGESTPAERDTWPPKVAFAKAYKVGHASETEQAAAKMALVDGETLDDFCDKLLAKEDAFFKLSMFAEGFKRKTNVAIESAQNVDDIALVMEQAGLDMRAAIADFKESLLA